jgi:dTDP-4-amino-4,6-dideoxygalactose transaminase
LKHFKENIIKRKSIVNQYRNALKNINGITYFSDLENVSHNYSYFPVFVDEKEYGIARDTLYCRLKENGIYTRRYFYPLISQFPTYRGLESASDKKLKKATKISNQVICLPLNSSLKSNEINNIVNIIYDEFGG